MPMSCEFAYFVVLKLPPLNSKPLPETTTTV
jgi:hypothetical protein